MILLCIITTSVSLTDKLGRQVIPKVPQVSAARQSYNDYFGKQYNIILLQQQHQSMKTLSLSLDLS